MTNFERSLAVLLDGEVELVVIGGAAMYILGSAHLTSDLDVCYKRTSENIERLAGALAPYHPMLRGAPSDLPFHFDVPTVTRGMNFTLATDLGPVDLLGEVAGIGQYSEVSAQSNLLTVVGRKCRVLSVEGMIASKRAAGRARDLVVLPELEALRELEILRTERATHSPGSTGEPQRSSTGQGDLKNNGE